MTEGVLVRAAATGAFAIVQWILETTDIIPNNMVIHRAMDQAAAHGHLNLLQWLYQHYRVLWSPDATNAALRNGHFETATWMYGPSYDSSIPCTTFHQAALYAFSAGDVRILDWLRERGQLPRLSNRHMERARRSGHVHVLDYVEQQFPTVKRSILQFNACSACGGSIPVAQWALKRGVLLESTSVLMMAARHGHIEFLQWYGDVFDGKLATATDPHGLAIIAARGHVECVQFLVENDFAAVDLRVLERAVENGHVELAQWLCDSYLDDEIATARRYNLPELNHRTLALALDASADLAARRGHHHAADWVRHLGHFESTV